VFKRGTGPNCQCEREKTEEQRSKLGGKKKTVAGRQEKP